jgi:hypothetical protein
MTVSSETNKVTYSGDGSTATFSTSFSFSTNDEITVTLVTNSTGAETAWTLGTQYTLTGAGTGSAGSLVVDTSPSDYTPASGTTLVIELKPAFTQTTSLPRGGTVSPKDTLEPMHDKRVRQLLYLKGLAERAVKVPVGETSGGSLPVSALRADKALIFNSSGVLTVSTDDYEDQAAAAATSATASAASATAAASSATAAASSASTASGHATSASNYAVKVDGAASGSDYSSKAWAVGGTGVTDTSSKGAAKEWAIETSGTVDGTSYSSKEYAQGTQASTGGSAKSWAQDTDQVNGASTNDRSAKNWAQGSSMTGSTLGGSAKDWAQTAEDSQVNGSEYSSKHYSLKAAASASAAASSATAAASGQIYSTVVNQTGSTLSPALSADGTYYLCDTSSNSITVTLPAIGTSEGTKLTFQKTHASNSLIFQRSGSDTLNGSASNITLTDVDANILFVSDNNSPDNWVGTSLNQMQAGTGLTKTGSVMSVTQSHLKQVIAIACSDETTALTTGTAKTTFHMPYAFTLTGVKAGVTTAPAGSVLTVDINEAGATILTTKLTIDAGEKTSATAATAAVIGGAGPALADNALMTVDIDGVGSSTAGTGLKIYLIGYAT